MSTRHLPLAAIALLVAVGTAAQAFATSQGVDLSRSTGQLWYVSFSYAVVCWLEPDRRARNISAPFEYSAFMFFAWPVLAPYYLFKSRRWRGLALGFGLVALSMLPDFASIAVYYALVDE